MGPNSAAINSMTGETDLNIKNRDMGQITTNRTAELQSNIVTTDNSIQSE